MKQLLTVNELAQYFNVSHMTVRRMMRRGDLPRPIRVGRRGLRWQAEDIERFLYRNRVKQ